MNPQTPSAEMFEAFQKMINPMAFPMQNLLMGAMKPEELERKIAELQTVHHWLTTNVGLLELTIKTLEYQKALLAPTKTGDSAPSAVDNPFLNPALWPWPYQAAATAAGDKAEPDSAAGRPAGRKAK